MTFPRSMNDGLSYVRIKNYQSIADAEFEPGALTVIVGDNDAGKSAILRALHAAFFNETGAGFITKGEETATVDIAFHDDVWLRWRKKREGGAYYELARLDVNGERHPDETQKFTKLGAKVPPKVAQALRIARIEVDKSLTITPQVQWQDEYYFLVDKPEGQVARALAKMTKLDVVVTAQQLIRTDLKRTRAELKACEDNIARLEQQLAEFGDLDAEVKSALDAENSAASINWAVDAIANMRQAWERFGSVRVGVDFAIPDESAIVTLKAQYNETRERVVAWREFTEARDGLSALPATIPDIPDLSAQYERVFVMAQANVVYATRLMERDDAVEALQEHDEAAAADIAAYNAIEVCPECGQPLAVLT